MSIPDIGKIEFKPPTPKTSLNLGTMYLFDYDRGDFVIENGRLIEVNDLEAIQAWVNKILRTEKLRFSVYEDNDDGIDYGVSVQEFIVGKKYALPFVESQLKREINDALNLHPRIYSISDWKFKKVDDQLLISFTINLVDQNSISKEVIYPL
ncbi:DUF2634 domain-containing protein [Brevibacillus laterosporus]|nr:DUF2634 domain-containing protein [Brevibacillus laterosporus]TPG71174.1 DUF2634 domain-containing protein [Brevibacillus laterosporus]